MIPDRPTVAESIRALAAKREGLEARARVLRSVREFFTSRGFLEVNVPIRSTEVIPEDHIEPIQSGDRLLVTSPEIFMKQMLAAGYPRIFTLGPCFRQGERGSRHHPEFWMLEWYRAGGDGASLCLDVEELFRHLFKSLALPHQIRYRGRTADFDLGWQETSVQDAFLRYASWDPVEAFDADRFDLDLDAKVEPALGWPRPEFLTRYPAKQASLARLMDDDPMVADRVEVYVCSLELANGFAELTDPGEQRARFEQTLEHRRACGYKPLEMPERFLEALESMPRAAGMALGLDRLVMLLTGSHDIDQVVAFPPEMS